MTEYFSLFLDSSNDSYLVPILLTVLLQDGNDVNELVNGISQQILTISQQLLLTQAVFLLDVSDRFGKI